MALRDYLMGFNKHHKMPYPRLQWHVQRCKDKIKREEEGLPIHHCKYNFLHIYLNEEELA